ncbi:uncharacterized protein METZ01_LOCUS25259, partial [marine metagenome]
VQSRVLGSKLVRGPIKNPERTHLPVITNGFTKARELIPRSVRQLAAIRQPDDLGNRVAAPRDSHRSARGTCSWSRRLIDH